MTSASYSRKHFTRASYSRDTSRPSTQKIHRSPNTRITSCRHKFCRNKVNHCSSSKSKRKTKMAVKLYICLTMLIACLEFQNTFINSIYTKNKYFCFTLSTVNVITRTLFSLLYVFLTLETFDFFPRNRCID